MRWQNLARKAAACICMLAVALLYAPLAAAALAAPATDCCIGGLCPIRGNHLKSQELAAPQNAMPMDCGHDMSDRKSSGMSECSMSGCQSPEHPVSIPGAFVLPDVTLLPAARELVRPVQASALEEISLISKPLSPPPRNGASIL
ncbi:MAG TPA: hypothetical protein VMP68_29285 [Candidatus Eisenbacteria bacterium]|nr:hypothetical protein [Candidatus Eisenbacteria bacterium]